LVDKSRRNKMNKLSSIILNDLDEIIKEEITWEEL